MTYRDELEAARARVAALETENEHLRSANAELERKLADRDARVATLFARYVTAAVAYARGEPSDEAFMRRVEDAMHVDASGRDLARREIANYVGALQLEGRSLAPRQHDRLRFAIETILNAG